ncbi:MAG: TM0106 family RecB-like putative nuclease [Spirochaetota bacterium]
MKRITASMLYDYLMCPHRLYLDVHGDQTQRDPESVFMRLLWEKGTLFEKEVVGALQAPFTDLSGQPGDRREERTREAMARGKELIYGGRIRADDLLGDPDLLRRQGAGYAAGDIKSGSGLEGGSEQDEGRPKERYAVQLGLYTDILERLGASAGRSAFIWDVHGREVPYNLDDPAGGRRGRPLWRAYRECLEAAREVVHGRAATLPAWFSGCKLCHWRSHCFAQLAAMDDLTLIPELGRSRRDALCPRVRTITELASCSLEPLTRGKKTVFPRIGADTLLRYQVRARLLKDRSPRPVVRRGFTLPMARVELFFDIETDPMRDLCYLHGFVERRDRDPATERYTAFFAESPTAEGEREAFDRALDYVRSLPGAVLYYYSRYEPRWWLQLQERYPEAAARAEVEELFCPGRAVDLYYDVVKPFTDWPANDYSIKSLAKFLGFRWRDASPSGAESVEWFNRWAETGDPEIKRRILEYNEDDCLAMRVLLDALAPEGSEQGEREQAR